MWAIIFAWFLGTFVVLLVVMNTFTKRISELERQRRSCRSRKTVSFDF